MHIGKRDVILEFSIARDFSEYSLNRKFSQIKLHKSERHPLPSKERMAAEFESVELSEFTAAGELQKISDAPLRLRFDRKEKDEALLFQKGC